MANRKTSNSGQSSAYGVMSIAQATRHPIRILNRNNKSVAPEAVSLSRTGAQSGKQKRASRRSSNARFRKRPSKKAYGRTCFRVLDGREANNRKSFE